MVSASRFMQEVDSGTIGGEFGLLEMGARMSARTQKIGEIWRTVTTPNGPDGPDGTIRIGDQDHYKLADVYAYNDSWAVSVSLIPIDEKPEDAVKAAISEAEKVVNKEKCKTAIEGLFKKALIQKLKDEAGVDYAKLKDDEKSAYDSAIGEFNAKKLISTVNSAAKVYEPNNLNLAAGDDHESATTGRPGGKLTITFYAGFFNQIYSGKTGMVVNNNEQKPYKGESTSLEDRAFTIIHEGIHAIDPRFSDGFIGRIIKNKNKDLSRTEGSKTINEFIRDNCR